MSTIRLGLICGKEFDFVDTPGSMVDTSFLADLPQAYRKRADKPRQFWPGMSQDNADYISIDVAIAWYIQKHYSDIEVDFIFPEDITVDRLKSNVCNFVIGYDAVDAICESQERMEEVYNAFKRSGNILPSFEVQESVWLKSKYMQKALDEGIAIAPTIFAERGSRRPDVLLQEIKARGWQTFIIKQSYACGSMGVTKLHVQDCEEKPEILEEYFQSWSECPEYIVQEFIEGFCRNWEVKLYWFNGQFQYAMGHKSAVAAGQKASMVTDEGLPQELLEQAKKFGKQALQALPQETAPNGMPIEGALIRTDIGISDSQLHDKDYAHWDGSCQMLFLNEIELSACTWFCRALKWDSLPHWADLWVGKAREIAEKMTVVPEAKKESDFRSASIETCLISDTMSVSSGKCDKSSDSDDASE